MPQLEKKKTWKQAGKLKLCHTKINKKALVVGITTKKNVIISKAIILLKRRKRKGSGMKTSSGSSRKIFFPRFSLDMCVCVQLNVLYTKPNKGNEKTH